MRLIRLFRLQVSRLQASLVLLLALAVGGPALAQTCAMPGRDGTGSSSGTVNSYYPPANGSYSPASSSIPLGTRQGAAVSVAPGDLVVVMQMQCASINTTNTSGYGAGNGTGRGYTDPAGCLAGRYEYVRAGAATTNTSLDLTGSPLVGSYIQDPSTVTNRRTFQVIRVPQHSALTLGGTINTPYWNGQTGGVVLLDVAGALNWNGQTIDVARRGFRGAAAVQWTGTNDTDTPPDYVATFASDQHGTKGEGIAGTPRFVLDAATSTRTDNGAGWGGYANGDHGRGAPGNAGGGGDDRAGDRDNGGGGGGGNGGIGGYGAYGWKSTGWSGTFTTSDFDMRGIGGAALASSAPNRIVMGGGGGAGGTNDSGADPVDSSGGAGGGIVIVRAGSMSGSGTVNAAGAAGRANALQDGAGGGGAGGSVVLMTPGGGLGAVTVNVAGGQGGDSFLGGTAAHAGGGGGAGGVVIRSGAVTANLAGAINGLTNTGDNPVGGASHGASPGAGGTSTQTADSSFTTRPSALCLPVLTVTKQALTPSVTTATATSVSYTLVVSNSGGAATSADLVDNTLPPGWTFSQTSGLVFAPALSASTWGGFVEGATPGQPAVAGSPGTPANLSTNGAPTAAPVWANLTIPGITGGTPGVVTLSFVVSLPASAPVGCFHNPAGVKYLDPTRVTAGREITPSTNNTSNRAGAQVGGTANTSYETSPGSSSTVPGSNHSGLPAGPVLDDVCLLGDLSIAKTAPASLAAGQTLTYTLTPRNNGRTIRDLSYASDQATDASNASATTRVLANGQIRVTDTLPNGIAITNAIAPTGWSCGLSGQTVTCDSTIGLPVVATTNLDAITGTVRISNTACSGPVVNTVTIAGFQAPYSDSLSANNTATASTTLDCNAALTVTKTNGTGTVTSGTTTTYTVTFVNSGPSSADGAIATDQPGTGLSSCSVLSCNASGGSPVGASCPATPANLLTPGGTSVPSLPAGGSVAFAVQCTVSASGI
jgi:uncharacterized repeat protein (TIGR01451 family)